MKGKIHAAVTLITSFPRALSGNPEEIVAGYCGSPIKPLGDDSLKILRTVAYDG